MLNHDEEWKPVINFEGLYEVSNLGRIRNTRGKILKTYIINSGYEALKFTVNGKRTNVLVHRAVAEVFCKKDSKTKTEVNHINEIKSDNRAINLQWCTSKENKQHSIKSGAYNKIFTTKNSLGKKHLKNTTSKYHNVTYDKSRDKWKGCIRVKGKNMYPKRFKTEVEAALHVNWIIDTLSLKDRPKNIIM